MSGNRSECTPVAWAIEEAIAAGGPEVTVVLLARLAMRGYPVTVGWDGDFFDVVAGEGDMMHSAMGATLEGAVAAVATALMETQAVAGLNAGA